MDCSQRDHYKGVTETFLEVYGISLSSIKEVISVLIESHLVQKNICGSVEKKHKSTKGSGILLYA